MLHLTDKELATIRQLLLKIDNANPKKRNLLPNLTRRIKMILSKAERRNKNTLNL